MGGGYGAIVGYRGIVGLGYVSISPTPLPYTSHIPPIYPIQCPGPPGILDGILIHSKGLGVEYRETGGPGGGSPGGQGFHIPPLLAPIRYRTPSIRAPPEPPGYVFIFQGRGGCPGLVLGYSPLSPVQHYRPQGTMHPRPGAPPIPYTRYPRGWILFQCYKYSIMDECFPGAVGKGNRYQGGGGVSLVHPVPPRIPRSRAPHPTPG